MRNINKYATLKKINTTCNDIRIANETRQELKEITKALDTNIWKEELEIKSRLYTYSFTNIGKKNVQFYDNRQSSIIIYKARTNCLNHTTTEKDAQMKTHLVKYAVQKNETLEHFLL